MQVNVFEITKRSGSRSAPVTEAKEAKVDTKTTDAGVPTSDVPFIYVDLQNPDDWEKIEMILTQAQRRTDGQTSASPIGRDR